MRVPAVRVFSSGEEHPCPAVRPSLHESVKLVQAAGPKSCLNLRMTVVPKRGATSASRTEPAARVDMLPRRIIKQVVCAFALAITLPVLAPANNIQSSEFALYVAPRVQPVPAKGNAQDFAGPVTKLGEIKLRYETRKGFRKSRPSIAAVAGRRAVEVIVSQLNRQVALTFDINVLFIECDEDEAYYDKSSKEIAICYQKLERFYYLFSRKLRGEKASEEATRGATVSLFLHELAHALIDVWELPITGNEEDAADQFATLLMLNGMVGGERMALSGALTFKLYAEAERGLRKLYWDSHSLDEQRYYNTICLIYGHRPAAYQYLIDNGTLPVQRAINCEDDYPRLKKSWQTLLYPFSKRSPSQFVIAGSRSFISR